VGALKKDAEVSASSLGVEGVQFMFFYRTFINGAIILRDVNGSKLATSCLPAIAADVAEAHRGPNPQLTRVSTARPAGPYSL
jgi:hypothetical protein